MVGTPIHTISQNLSLFAVSDASVSVLSALVPAISQPPIPPSDDSPPAPSLCEPTLFIEPPLVVNDEHNDISDISIDCPPGAASEEFQYLISQSYDSPSTLNLRDSRTSIEPSLLIDDKHNDGLNQYSTIAIDCGCSSSLAQIRTSDSDSSSNGEVKILNFGPSVIAADPYANNLRIESLCIIAALYTLAGHVGLTEETIYAEKPLSPFFWSSTEASDDMAKANTICTVQRIFTTLKPDMRPVSEQITVDHHPHIDILPFPTLRKNLIIHQEEFDHDRFFHDIQTGLLCWGGADIGRRDRQNSTGFPSTGTPWDVRSWEAKEWFLKKYWTLLGGEDGELVRQSEWWRNMRGDDPLHIENA